MTPGGAGAGGALVLVGLGALGRVAADSARASGVAVAGCLDDTHAVETVVEGVTVLGGFEALERATLAADRAALPTIADGAARAELLHRIAAAELRAGTLVDGQARVAATARLGPCAFVNAFAAVFPGAVAGAGLILDNHASIGVDARLDDAVFVGPAAQLCRGVAVGTRSFVGAGAIVLPGVRIGEDATIGAGAVVRRDVPDGTVVASVTMDAARRPPGG